MKKYLDYIKSKSPHERRQHAMQLSTGIIAVIFVAWISTIGLRFASTPPQTADDGTGSNSGVTQLANVASAGPQQNTLIVATTTTYNY